MEQNQIENCCLSINSYAGYSPRNQPAVGSIGILETGDPKAASA